MIFINRRMLVIALLMFAGAGLAFAMKPTQKIADASEMPDLNTMIPRQIGEWKIQPAGLQDKTALRNKLPDLPDSRGSVVWPIKAGGADKLGMGVGGYIYVWENNVKEEGGAYEGGQQLGLAELESIDIISAGKSVPMVFAITVELAE